jgi:hypothetical protein
MKHHLQPIQVLLKKKIKNLEKDHIEPLQKDERGLSIARLTNDTVATTCATVGLASIGIFAVPCLIGTAAASLSIVGTSFVDVAIHNRAEAKVKQFMEEFIKELKDSLSEVAKEVLGEDQVQLIERLMHKMHNDPDLLATFAHALFVAGEVCEHIAAPLMVTTARTLNATVGFAKVIRSAYPAVQAGIKVLPILGAVFSGVCLAHSAVHYGHNSTMVNDLEIILMRLKELLSSVEKFQNTNFIQLITRMAADTSVKILDEDVEDSADCARSVHVSEEDVSSRIRTRRNSSC